MNIRVVLVSFMAAVFLLIPAVYSFGMGPVSITISNATRGQEYDRLLQITNPSNSEVTVAFNTTGDAGSWITVRSQQNTETSINVLTIPANSASNIIARIRVPDDAPSGDYFANLSAQQAALEGGNLQSGFGVKVTSEIRVQVTGQQTVSGNVKDISLSDTEVGRPLVVSVQFQNTGNVFARPNIKITISKGGSQVSQIDYSEATVRVGATTTINVNWDTSGYATGDYQANVKVLLEGRLLSEKTINFKILERGELTAAGSIISQSFPEELSPGKPGKLEIQFRNTGEIQVGAKIKAEVYLNDELVDVVEGDAVTVDIGQTQTLAAYYTPEVEGEYSIKFFVSYEGKSTETRTISFASASESGSPQQQEQQAQNAGAPQNNNDNTQIPGEAANAGSPITGGALDSLKIDVSFLAPVAVIAIAIIFGALVIFTMVRRNRAPRGYSFGG